MRSIGLYLCLISLTCFNASAQKLKLKLKQTKQKSSTTTSTSPKIVALVVSVQKKGKSTSPTSTRPKVQNTQENTMTTKEVFHSVPAPFASQRGSIEESSSRRVDQSSSNLLHHVDYLPWPGHQGPLP